MRKFKCLSIKVVRKREENKEERKAGNKVFEKSYFFHDFSNWTWWFGLLYQPLMSYLTT